MALLFIAAGFLALWNPREVFVAHSMPRHGNGVVEVVSKDRSVIYGFISLGFGCVSLVGAMTCNNWYSGARDG
jgi:hypothetical protein